MQRIIFIGIFIGVLSCSSVHPIMEAEPLDLSQTVAGSSDEMIPRQLVDSLGWHQLSDPLIEGVNEEFRIVLKSGSLPYHAFRIVTNRQAAGEGILFWPKTSKALNSVAPQENMRDYLKGTCEEILDTPDYQYCIPKLTETENWSAVYNNLVNNNIWTIPDQSEMELGDVSSSNPWQISVQTRYQNYYREYSHQNPDQYGGGVQALNVLALAAQLRQISNNFMPPQNFNVYLGITSGVRGSDFTLCENNEVWRFNGDLSELISKSGFPTTFEEQDSLLFFLNVQGTVRDEWYAQRENSGFSKVINPTEINNIQIVGSRTCPDLN